MKIRSIYISVILLLAAMLAAVPEARGELRCQRYDFAAMSQAMQSHIANVQQDESGFMWFATWNGLVRFDGYCFHTFQPVALSDGMLESNRVYNLRVVSTGNLLCLSSDNHLSMFDRERFKFVDLQSLIPEVAHLRTLTLRSLKNGHTWVIFRDDSALRLSDSDPTGDYTVYPSTAGVLAGCGGITGVCHTVPDDEWLLTHKAAYNVTADKSLVGDFRTIISVAGMLVGVTAEGEAKIYNRNLGLAEDVRLFDRVPTGITTVTSVHDKVYVASDCGVSIVDARTGVVTQCTRDGVSQLYRDSSDRVWCVFDDGRVGVIEVGSRGDVVFPRIIDRKLRSLRAQENENADPRSTLIFSLRDGRVIMQTANVPLSVYNESQGELEPILMSHDGGTVSISPTSTIKKYMVDAADNLWVFHERGAECYSFSDNHFTHVPNPSSKETRAMMSDRRGRLWIADRSNYVSIGDAPGKHKRYVYRNGKLGERPEPFSPSHVYAMREDADGNVWFATKGDGLYMLELEQKGATESYRVTHFSRSQGGEYLPTDTVYDVLPYRGRVWVGSYGGGLSRGDRQADGTYRFEYVKNQPQGLKIRGMRMDEPGGVLMLATTDGLVTADVSSSRSRFFCNRYRREPWGLKGNDVMEIIRANDSYYVCVFGVGVSRIDTENLLSDSIHFTTYPLPSGAAAGQIRTAIAYDDDIWIMSDRTVSRFSTGTGLYATRFMGLGVDRHNLSESDPVVKEGRIIAATSEGVMMFVPDNLVSDGATSPLPVVTGIQYQNDPEVYPLNDLSELTIEHNQRSFTLFLSLMTFHPAQQPEGETPQLRYRLEGYDRGWNYSPVMQPAVNYNNLRPGHYTLTIETLNPDGSWSSEPRLIDVRVKALLTETLLFKIVLVLVVLAALGGMGFAVYRFRRMRDEIHRKYSLLMSVDNISSTHTPEHLAVARVGSREEKERRFLDDTAEFIAASIDNPELMVEDLARNAGMSRTAYYTRLKQLTGLTPVEFIRQMRIKKALKLLEEGHLSVTEVAYGVGFSDPKYFSRCFKAEMGMTPSQYVEKVRAEK